jgi:hypothetical protein
MNCLSYHYSNRCKISAVGGKKCGRHLLVLCRFVGDDVNRDILYASTHGFRIAYLKDRYCFQNQQQEEYTVLDKGDMKYKKNP